MSRINGFDTATHRPAHYQPATHRHSSVARWACVVRTTLWLSCFTIVVLVGMPETSAQVVQLPSFGTFGIGTTVSVPDRGATLLGGVSRGASGSVSRGVPGLSGVPGAGRLFGNRAIGSSRSVSTASVHLTIIDLEELDRETLAEAARRREARVERDRAAGVTILDDEQKRRAEFLNRYMGRDR